jgi:hypothetical protein
MLDFFWIFVSIIKFQFALVTSTFILSDDLLVVKTVLYSIIGVFIFTFLNYRIKKLFTKKKKGKVFSKKNRLLVKLRRRFGVFGICMFLPLFGIPLTIGICYTLTSNKLLILIYMIFSVIFWSFLFFISNKIYIFALNT